MALGHPWVDDGHETRQAWCNRIVLNPMAQDRMGERCHTWWLFSSQHKQKFNMIRMHLLDREELKDNHGHDLRASNRRQGAHHGR